jgi:type II secretory ATPase GspE/PulE/Tfp pilus assembly ATPase PilB-like protein
VAHLLEQMDMHSMAFHTDPFEEAVRDILTTWSTRGASDFHIVYQKSGDIVFRARIHALLRDIHLVERTKAEYYKKAMFRLFRLDLQIQDDSQDTRFSLGDYDYRVSFLPFFFGPSLVLRAIKRDQAFNIDTYAMPDDEREIFKDVLKAKACIVFVTGRTGSGKSTLMYNGISHIVSPAVRIATLEDPVEYTLQGVDPCEVREGARFDYDRALRGLVRHNIDVLLLGETRDRVSALAAMAAANQGTLVITTMHTKSARKSIDKLRSWGINEEEILTSTKYISCQRLVPKLCAHCAIDDEQGAAYLARRFGSRIIPKKSNGCSSCLELGTSGMMLLFESIQIANGHLIESSTMTDRGLDLVKKGVIDAYQLTN